MDGLKDSEIQRILEARAEALARPVAKEDEEDAIVVVVLALGVERYGVPIEQVQEVQPLPGVTPVPGIPPFWEGLVNLRGRLYPVLDLRRHLALPEGEPDAPGKIVVVSGAEMTVALRVDDVPGVRKLRLAEIGPALPDGPSSRREVRGVTADLLAVLDVEALLGDPRLVMVNS